VSQPTITEEWRKIPGYSEIYEVSNFGEVRSWSHLARGNNLKITVGNDGFPEVRVCCSDGKRRWRWVHALVALAFPEEES
jgi:hypothetical protein